MILSNDSKVFFIRDAFNSSDPYVWKIPVDDYNIPITKLVIDIKIGLDNSREITAISRQNTIILFTIEQDGRVAVTKQDIRLQTEDEEITVIGHDGML